MSRNNKSETIRVIVDVDKASKCNWCGTLESNKWRTSQEGKIFCCSECRCAYYYKRSHTIITLSIIIGLPIVAISLVAPGLAGVSLGIGILIVFACAVNIPIYTTGSEYAKKVLKNSRTGPGTTELMMIRRISAPIECPNCDGKLDLSKIEVDMVYHCEYCGATGKVEVIKSRK